MPDANTRKMEMRLTLSSRLEDLARVWPWVDTLAAEYSIPADTLFAVHLCLEEALSNIIRHGYRGQPNQTIELSFAYDSAKEFLFTIEDSAPHFSPGDAAQARRASEELQNTAFADLLPGGHGLSLMRKFAGSLKWEQLPRGNRLVIGFPV
jgi:serine/threonine-protein kinase RsbW